MVEFHISPFSYKSDKSDKIDIFYTKNENEFWYDSIEFKAMKWYKFTHLQMIMNKVISWTCSEQNKKHVLTPPG